MENIDIELKDLICCKICQKTYETPIILPCLNNICQTHIDIGCEFKCLLCTETHQIPKNGFAIDSKIINLIKISSNYINLNRINYGKTHHNAKEACELFEKLLDVTHTLKNDPLYFIDNYFSKLKNEIDLKKEEYTMLIENNHDRIINEIENFESICKTEAKQKSFILNDLIQISKKKLEKWNAELKIPNFDNEGNWKRITIRAKEETEKLKALVTSFQDDLLMNKEIKFSSKSIVNNNNFGDVIFSEKDKIDTNRSEASFQLVIRDFSQFRRNYEWRESLSPCFISNIPWKISTKIEQTDEFDLALGFYVYPEYDDKKLKQNPISAEVKLRVFQDNTALNSKVKLYRRFAHKFNESIGNGCPSFLLLKDIMDANNGIYDKENDSIKLEATIKVLG